jgi:hypothetical protein
MKKNWNKPQIEVIKINSGKNSGNAETWTNCTLSTAPGPADPRPIQCNTIS